MPVLQFKGKTAIENFHHTVSHHTLDVDNALSLAKKPDLEGNLIIEGDNLIALKSLLPTHAGKIKCVYIDPPYNTGNEGWIYNDNLTQPQFKEWIGKTVGKEGEDATRHDKWCCMMYPRLRLLHDLLTDDGAILISIDDNELHSLKLIMDEIFGSNNWLATIVWEKGRKNDARFFSVGHEYLVVYAKSKEKLIQADTYWREEKPGAREIQSEFESLKRRFGEDHERVEEALKAFYGRLPKGHPAKKHSRYSHVDARGVWRDDNMSWPGGGGPDYDVPHPKTHKPCAVPDGGWRYATSEKMQEMIRAGIVVFRKDHTEPPIRKTYLIRSVGPSDEELSSDDDVGIQVMGSYLYKSAEPASKVLAQIFGKKVFDNPKDHEVIARFIRYCSRPGDFILDSFAGSGTTAHSVLTLRKEGEASRKFVLVQMRHDTNAQEAEGVNICQEITAERVRRVIGGYGTGKGKVGGLGGEFTYARVGKPIFDEYRNLGAKPPSYEEVARYVWFTETSRTFERKQLDPKSGLIGKLNGISYYLLYSPGDKDARGLDTTWLKELKDKNPRKVVYCEKIWIHREDLKQFGDVRPMLVPFNLK